MPLFAGKTFFVFARGLVPGFGKVLIATPSAAPMRDEDTLARSGEIGDGLAALVVEDERANGYVQDEVRAGVASAIGAFAVASALGFKFAIVAVAEQGVVVRIGFQIDAAPVAAIAARGTAPRNKLLTAKSHAAVTAVASLYEYFGFINEQRNNSPRKLTAMRSTVKKIA